LEYSEALLRVGGNQPETEAAKVTLLPLMGLVPGLPGESAILTVECSYEGRLELPSAKPAHRALARRLVEGSPTLHAGLRGTALRLGLGSAGLSDAEVLRRALEAIPALLTSAAGNTNHPGTDTADTLLHVGAEVLTRRAYRALAEGKPARGLFKRAEALLAQRPIEHRRLHMTRLEHLLVPLTLDLLQGRWAEAGRRRRRMETNSRLGHLATHVIEVEVKLTEGAWQQALAEIGTLPRFASRYQATLRAARAHALMGLGRRAEAEAELKRLEEGGRAAYFPWRAGGRIRAVVSGRGWWPGRLRGQR